MKKNNLYILTFFLLLLARSNMSAANIDVVIYGDLQMVVKGTVISVAGNFAMKDLAEVDLLEAATVTVQGQIAMKDAALLLDGAATKLTVNNIQYAGIFAKDKLTLNGGSIITNYICRTTISDEIAFVQKAGKITIEDILPLPTPTLPVGGAYFDIGNANSTTDWTGGEIFITKGHGTEYSALINSTTNAPVHGGILKLKPAFAGQYYKVKSTAKIDSLIMDTTKVGLDPVLELVGQAYINNCSLTSAGNNRLKFQDSIHMIGNLDNNLDYLGIDTATTVGGNKAFFVFEGAGDQNITNSKKKLDRFNFKYMLIRNGNKVNVAKSTDFADKGELLLDNGSLYAASDTLTMQLDAKIYKYTAGAKSQTLQDFTEDISVQTTPNGRVSCMLAGGEFNEDKLLVYPTTIVNGAVVKQLMASQMKFPRLGSDGSAPMEYIRGSVEVKKDKNNNTVTYQPVGRTPITIVPKQEEHKRAVAMYYKLGVYWSVELDTTTISDKLCDYYRGVPYQTYPNGTTAPTVDRTWSNEAVSVAFYATQINNTQDLEKCKVVSNFKNIATASSRRNQPNGSAYWSADPGKVNSVIAGGNTVYFNSDGILFNHELAGGNYAGEAIYSGCKMVSGNQQCDTAWRPLRQIINTDWTLLRRVYYSRKSGDWTDTTCWTFYPTHDQASPSVSADSYWPCEMQYGYIAGTPPNTYEGGCWRTRDVERFMLKELDSAIIGNGHHITLTAGSGYNKASYIAYLSVGTNNALSPVFAGNDTTGYLSLAQSIYASASTTALPQTNSEFILRDNSTIEILKSWEVDGIEAVGIDTGAIRTAKRSYSTYGRYIYTSSTNGAAMASGTGLPDTVKTLISNMVSYLNINKPEYFRVRDTLLVNTGYIGSAIKNLVINKVLIASGMGFPYPAKFNNINGLTACGSIFGSQVDTLRFASKDGSIDNEKYLIINMPEGLVLNGNLVTQNGNLVIKRSNNNILNPKCDLMLRGIGITFAKLGFGDDVNTPSYFVLDNMINLRLQATMKYWSSANNIHRTYGLNTTTTKDNLANLLVDPKKYGDNHYVACSDNSGALYIEINPRSLTSTDVNSIENVAVWPIGSHGKYGGVELVQTSKTWEPVIVDTAGRDWYHWMRDTTIEIGFRTNYGKKMDKPSDEYDYKHIGMTDASTDYWYRYYSVLYDKNDPRDATKKVLFDTLWAEFTNTIGTSGDGVGNKGNANDVQGIWFAEDVYETPNDTGKITINMLANATNNVTNSNTAVAGGNVPIFDTPANNTIGRLRCVYYAVNQTDPTYDKYKTNLSNAFDIFFGAGDALNPPKLFMYSLKDGNWNDPTVWTYSSTHVGVPNPDNTYPHTLEMSAVISGGHKITLNEDINLMQVFIGSDKATTPDKYGYLKLPEEKQIECDRFIMGGGDVINVRDTSTTISYLDGDPPMPLLIHNTIIDIKSSTLEIASKHGINTLDNAKGHILSKILNLTPYGTYIYNGAASQGTGDALPDSVGSLIINNPNNIVTLNKNSHPIDLLEIKDNSALDMKDKTLVSAGRYNNGTGDACEPIGQFIMGKNSDIYIGGSNNFQYSLNGYEQYKFYFPPYNEGSATENTYDRAGASKVIFNGDVSQTISAYPDVGNSKNHWNSADGRFYWNNMYYSNYLNSWPAYKVRTDYFNAIGENIVLAGANSLYIGNPQYHHYYPVEYPQNAYGINRNEYHEDRPWIEKDDYNPGDHNGGYDRQTTQGVTYDTAYAEIYKNFYKDAPADSTWYPASRFAGVNLNVTNVNVGFPEVELQGGQKNIDQEMLILRNLIVGPGVTLTVENRASRLYFSRNRLRVYKNIINEGEIINNNSIIEVGN